MSSQSHQSHDLLYATLTPKFNSSTINQSIQSHQFYSKANLSTNFNHSTPSIICSSPISTQSSSYETLKELHARFIKARQSSRNSYPIRQKHLRKESSTHRFYERTKQNQEFRKIDGFDVTSEPHSSFNNERTRTMGFFDLSPQLTRFYLEGSQPEEKNFNHQASNSISSQHSDNIKKSSSINWQSCKTNLKTLERFGLNQSPIEFANISTFEVDQKPIRTTSEPLWFAMSPLSSELEWQEGQINSEEETDDRSDWSSLLDDDEIEEEVLSNTSLSPIDIPGTKRILPICSSPLSTSASDGSTQIDTLSGSDPNTF
ncbi:uncharacterized protein MELLADRAFT_111436 [Melampsora larici-populina 98AG31]|uniref:Uncharacterized protein n=1 Tax=Melampsora larici-populina (strain 98AG31 / pathotype 3-4-7) TaxID=747676 RepID=F4S370_MELLP|nr:uncharacterized protein MELLADRAFT_111436 [Melampsora larici-populina 98AG31]EGG00960.1 hypothetical protein MELLADRAFT_111436 [Melampsora larici-populina 98AG31]